MSEDRDAENLGESFRQSRKEFRFMIVVWIVFAAWTGTYVSLSHRSSDGEALRLVWGMPDWVFFGIMLPWCVGLVLTVWFALFYMRDTDLHGGSTSVENGEGAE